LNNLLHFELADAGMSPTHWQASTFPEPFKHKITVVHDGIDTQALTQNPDVSLTLKMNSGQDLVLTRQDEVITFVNRNLEPYRGYHSLMRVLPEILKARPYAQVIIVGGNQTSYGAAPPQGQTWQEIFLNEVKEKLGGRCTSVLKDTGDLTKNVMMGLQELKSLGNVSNRVLIITMDLPYLETKLIDQFLDLCPDVDLAVPLISKEEYLDRFPSATGTFAKLIDGEWTVGCAYLFKPDVFIKALPKIEQVVANRKSVPKLAGILGLGFLWKVMTRSISVPEVVAKIEGVIGCKIAAVQMGPAEFAFDVDDIPDYEYALRNK
jgi:hypothetical protein